MEQVYRIGTININGISTFIKTQMLRDTLRAADLDIVFLQEVKPGINLHFYGYVVYDFPTNEGGGGTAILLREGITATDVTYLPSGRGVALTVGAVRMVNIYAPSGSSKRRERNIFYSEEVAPLFQGNTEHYIVGGDFNCVLRPEDQIPHFLPCPALQALTRNLALHDTWIVQHGDRRGYTHFTSHSASRLDRLYVSRNLRTTISGAEIWPTAFTNHEAYICAVTLPRQRTRRSRGLWRLNVAILKDAACRREVEETWHRCQRRRHTYDSTLTWWIRCAKPTLRRSFMNYSREKTSWQRTTSEFYYTALRELATQPPSPDRQKAVQHIKARLLRLTTEAFDGVRVRARTFDEIYGERPSMHYIIQERRHRRRTLITELVTEDGRRAETQMDIVRAFTHSYRTLYAEAPRNDAAMEDVIHPMPASQHTQDDAEFLADITQDELRTALLRGASNRSPGPDGLPHEFYRAFADLMGATWIRMFQELMNPTIQVPHEFTEGIMIPVPKPRGGHRPQDYRPLTLLNADYKLFARILRARLHTTVKAAIHADQTCLGGDNNVHTTLGSYRDIIALASTCRLKGVLVAVDFDHAFDRVNHYFLRAVMEHIGIPQVTTTVVLRLIHDAQSRVMVNGYRSEPITIGRSVRQGCPLSAMLFAVALEPALHGLRHRLEGISLRSAQFKCSAYADDVVFLAQSRDEIESALSWLHHYGEVSGSLLNLQKTKYMDIGRGLPTASAVPITKVPQIKCLGITFHGNVQKTAATTYRRLLQQMRAQIRLHKLRGLDMLQRARYVNMYLASKLNHFTHVLPLPDTIAARFQAAFGHFVTAGYIFKIRYNTLSLPRQEGGVGLTNVKNRARALLLRTTRRLWHSPHRNITGTLIDEVAPRSLQPPAPVGHLSPALAHFKIYFVEHSYMLTDLPTTREAMAKDYYNILQRRNPRNMIERRHPNICWKRVWRAIHSPFLPTEVRTSWYVLVNEKFPNRQRLHSIRLLSDPLCPQCADVDTDVHRLNCSTASACWKLTRQMLALLLRRPFTSILSTEVFYPDGVYFPPAKTNAINWIKGMALHYLYRDSDKNILDFWQYLLETHTTVQRGASYRTTFANFLGSLFTNPPPSWGVPGMRRE